MQASKNMALQDKISSLRNRIAHKRAGAKNVFPLNNLDLGGRIKEQICQVKDLFCSDISLELGGNTSEITIEDIFDALETLTAPKNGKAILCPKNMRESLRAIIASRLKTCHSKIPLKLRRVAIAEDFIILLESNFSYVSRRKGGATKLFEDALDLAEKNISPIGIRPLS